MTEYVIKKNTIPRIKNTGWPSFFLRQKFFDNDIEQNSGNDADKNILQYNGKKLKILISIVIYYTL